MLNNHMRKLGSLSVSSLGLGCVNLSGLYGKPLTDASKIIDYSFQNGITFFDTADAYANGQNELLLAASFNKYKITRQQIILSTKCGVVWNNPKSLSNVIDNSPSYIKKACEDSLKRLETDYIDLFYLHRIAHSGDVIEASMEALKELVQEGKIRHVGLSEANSAIIRRAHQVYPLTAVQSEYSLMTREPESNGVLSACRELNIGFVAYSPLCRGLLSDNFNKDILVENDFRHKFPRFKNENLEKNIQIVNQIQELAVKKECTIAQLSLAWLLAQGDYILPIPGTKCIKHLCENIESSHISLNAHDLSLLNKFFPIGIANGERYSQAILRAYNLTTSS